MSHLAAKPAQGLQIESPGLERPVIERWAYWAGVAGELVLIPTFFMNMDWWKQLGLVLPFGAVWLIGWWRLQGRLDIYEVAELKRRLAQATSQMEQARAQLLQGQSADDSQTPEDWRFEWRYQERRALERFEQAAQSLAELQKPQTQGWWRRRSGSVQDAP